QSFIARCPSSLNTSYSLANFLKHFSSLVLPFFLTGNPECPDPQGKTGVCAELCYSDKDCLCGELCCSNGCGHECISTTPGENKPGSCGSPWYFVWCGDRCQQDADCSGHLKCCPTLWGHCCLEPQDL
uniref:WAP domain-containing protein n=1 Tax=Poecilia reticulata TaxID=8081 RepID=A0A3P9Q433_POERE